MAASTSAFSDTTFVRLPARPASCGPVDDRAGHLDDDIELLERDRVGGRRERRDAPIDRVGQRRRVVAHTERRSVRPAPAQAARPRSTLRLTTSTGSIPGVRRSRCSGESPTYPAPTMATRAARPSRLGLGQVAGAHGSGRRTQRRRGWRTRPRWSTNQRHAQSHGSLTFVRDAVPHRFHPSGREDAVRGTPSRRTALQTGPVQKRLRTRRRAIPSRRTEKARHVEQRC